MRVLAFDRDWTIDVNPAPGKQAVPLRWVRYWSERTEHEVWAIGNQRLVDEAGIPGVVEAIRRKHGDIDVLGEQNERGRYGWWPDRDDRLHLLRELFPDVEDHIVVDDIDLSFVDGWDHYYAWDFCPAVEEGAIELPIPGGDYEESIGTGRQRTGRGRDD